MSQKFEYTHMIYDYVIIGGGIVGVSTAWQLQQRHPDKSVLIIEKESGFAQHQTGHNSGVIHAGVYYQPGSLKAKFCKAGMKATIDFCTQHDVPFDQCGKLLVATNDLEYQRMLKLMDRCKENNIEAELVDEQALKILEPEINGIGAILVKQTGIVNYQLLTEKMAEQFQKMGGYVKLNTTVIAMKETESLVSISVKNKNKKNEIEGRFLISCSGLMADRCTKMLGIKTDFQIIPFRGEYYQLPPKYNQVVKHLIYPIPDPELPFLGVHLTRMIDGSVTVGPNAVQGWKREGYGTINISLKDLTDMVSFSGFWNVLRNNFKTGIVETYNSWWKPGYLKTVQKYCPSITLADLKPYPAGVRAQAVMKNGDLVHDFLFAQSIRSLHVCNAPSPAATSAMPIGEYICHKIAEQQKKAD
jgi:L-2-hydroxyglutarate oxidase